VARKGFEGKLSSSILIADDNSTVRAAVSSFIKQNMDAEVCAEVDNGAEAVEKFKQLHPNIVILDFKMPVLDGLRAATQIKRLEPETKIILFTMFASRQMENYAQIFGVDEVVSKSDNGYKLLAAIRNPVRK